LYLDGKTPELNDKLANLTISGAKIFDVSFTKETGRVSIVVTIYRWQLSYDIVNFVNSNRS